MKVYDKNDILIYNIDTLDWMKTCQDNHIDLTITSPPYDDLRNYNGYCFPFEDICKELYRITKDGGVVIWIVADSVKNGSESGTSFRQALYFKEIGWNLHDTMIYAKNNPMPQTGRRYEQNFEYMFCFSKGKPKTFNPIMVPAKYANVKTANTKNRGKDGSLEYEKRQRKEMRKVGNIFTYSVGGGISTKDKIAFEHPAIFPEQLVKDQIETWSNIGDMIFDPFSGSGTTAKMAYKSKRKFVGTEISEDYFDISVERMEIHEIKEDDFFIIGEK